MATHHVQSESYHNEYTLSSVGTELEKRYNAVHMADEKTIRVRFAPSPTGFLHLGNYRTALFNYLFAKQNDGKFVLRIEDTDKQRSKKEYEDNILESLEWLGLKYDEFHRQSERVGTHRQYLEKLVAENKAYVSREPAKEGGGEVELIRFRNPNKVVTFTDLVRGEISVDTTDLGDFVLAKSFDEPVFHLVVVVDDFEMGITHVIRGEDHISNTPRHILIQEAIGAPRPIYAHIPLILSPDRSKLSKRRGALALTEYRNQGYLPEAVLNYMAFLGWNPGTEQELFTLSDLIKTFDISKVQKGGAVFNQEKLDWYNHEYLKLLTPEEFLSQAQTFLPELKTLPTLVPVLLERIHTLGDIKKMADAGELKYFFETPTYDKELLKSQTYLAETIALVEKIPEEDFTAEKIKSVIWDFATEKGRGEVLWPMRIALTGQKQSPDPFTIASVLGKVETLKRLTHAKDL